MCDKITIRAVNVIGLANVDVSIVAQDGTPIESGKAIEACVRSGKWTYIATKQVAPGTDIVIEVEGIVHAGNKAQPTENPRIGMGE